MALRLFCYLVRQSFNKPPSYKDRQVIRLVERPSAIVFEEEKLFVHRFYVLIIQAKETWHPTAPPGPLMYYKMDTQSSVSSQYLD